MNLIYRERENFYVAILTFHCLCRNQRHLSFYVWYLHGLIYSFDIKRGLTLHCNELKLTSCVTAN